MRNLNSVDVEFAKELMLDLETQGVESAKTKLKAGAPTCRPGGCHQPLYGVWTSDSL